MSYRARPAGTDHDEIVFGFRRLLDDLQDRLTELDDDVRALRRVAAAIAPAHEARRAEAARLPIFLRFPKGWFRL